MENLRQVSPGAQQPDPVVVERANLGAEPTSTMSPGGDTEPQEANVAPAEDGENTTGFHRSTSVTRRVVEWVLVLLVAVLAAGALRSYVVQAFYVPSGSMLPTLQIGDRILVVKFGYTVHRGDIVVFKRPPADTGTTDSDLVKRVIGLPGETISSQGSRVLVNGRPISEPWLPALSGACAESAENIPVTRIPPDHYFVMGDCRGNSADSRVWGTLPGSLIVGKVFVIVWRFGHPYLHWF
jgi:signal peptidase I